MSKLIIAALPSPRPEERRFLLVGGVPGPDAWCEIAVWQDTIYLCKGPTTPDAWPTLFTRYGAIITWTDAGLDLLTAAYDVMLTAQRVELMRELHSDMVCPKTADDWRVFLAHHQLDMATPSSP